MQSLRMTVALAATLVTGTALAQAPSPGKQVRLPQAEELVVGHQATQGRAVLVELVPRGQTVQNFDRLVTLQTAPGLGKVPTEAFLQEFSKRYAASCPGSSAIPVKAGNEPAMRIDCPKHPNTQRTETVFARAVGLGPDLGLVHITMRFLVMPKDAQWARDYLAGVTVQ